MYMCTHMYNINIMSIYIYNRPIIYRSAPSSHFHMHTIYIGRGKGREGKGREDIIMIGLYDSETWFIRTARYPLKCVRIVKHACGLLNHCKQTLIEEVTRNYVRIVRHRPTDERSNNGVYI